jgi:hypothetical protein
VLESLERRAFVAGIESDVPVTAIRSDISRDDQDAAHLSEDAKEEESFQDGRVNKKRTSTQNVAQSELGAVRICCPFAGFSKRIMCPVLERTVD